MSLGGGRAVFHLHSSQFVSYWQTVWGGDLPRSNKAVNCFIWPQSFSNLKFWVHFLKNFPNFEGRVPTVVSREEGSNQVFFKENWFLVNIFWSMCSMTLILFREYRYGIRRPSQYIEYGHTTRRNFFKSLSKQNSLKKLALLKHESTQFWKWISQKSKLSYISYHIFRLMCRMTLIIFWA